MIINHNISALNAHRQLGANQGGVQGSLEKLSSGLQINKAGDDAAGLAISEKMRGQIRGLEMATKNAQDGISLIQTAEGALNETHSILQRMRELSVQSSSDTNTEADRAELQKEVDQLAEEITRISSDTEFNTQTLLDGDFSATFQIGANSGQNISISVGEMSSDALKVGTQFTSTNDGAGNASITDGTTTATWQAADSDPAGDGSEPATVAGYYDGDTLVLAADQAIADGSTVTKGIDISSRDEADAAITTLDAAIQTVSAQRSNLGAVQNRLEHTINNLGTSAENLTAAESRIRDVDMAKEMMEFTKNNILSQAAQSMLAQANQQPQGVLQLLQ
ncbi:MULTISPECIES: flagellin [Oceanobacillus]|uniref:Flagellin n=1 Tax=Oceanobacillus kimchii TaxID=746691 RepID=A0ABQ5TMJ7_9BACI|nr:MULTISPECIES: flagellin [Oceanobacillus]MBT2600333.1 flagellin [Oceanobacillus sp. ISL-74]MBT2650491.1 flagellin [Oceanobacillus sp. ISL-73]GLO67382.1 flagellin [Oceanobacillus kimchii]